MGIAAVGEIFIADSGGGEDASLPAVFAWVEAPVGFLQVGDGEMEVSLGGGEGAVAEHFLDVAETGAVAHEMGGAGVPPDVGGVTCFFTPASRAYLATSSSSVVRPRGADSREMKRAACCLPRRSRGRICAV